MQSVFHNVTYVKVLMDYTDTYKHSYNMPLDSYSVKMFKAKLFTQVTVLGILCRRDNPITTVRFIMADTKPGFLKAAMFKIGTSNLIALMFT